MRYVSDSGPRRSGCSPYDATGTAFRRSLFRHAIGQSRIRLVALLVVGKAVGFAQGVEQRIGARARRSRKLHDGKK